MWGYLVPTGMSEHHGMISCGVISSACDLKSSGNNKDVHPPISPESLEIFGVEFSGCRPMPSILPRVWSILRFFLPLRPSGSSDMKIMMSSASDLVLY